MRRLTAIPAICLAALCLAPVAHAELSFERAFGGFGKGGGSFSEPAGIAANTATNNVYVLDRGQDRVEQFTSTGKFVRAWGYDVVTSGEDNKPSVNEVDEVRIRATGGSFALRFKGAETAQLPFDATAAEVQTALNGLSTISAGGGSVTVSGGPGDEAGSHPYAVTFSGGPLAKTNLELGIEPSGLAIPPGTALSCEGGPAKTAGFSGKAVAISYQWLANGVPVPGASASEFTPGEAEQGKAIQCRVSADFASAKTITASRPYLIASPAQASLPPLGPSSLAAPSGTAVVEALGGAALTCDAGAWSRGPESFTYRWYRNGAEIGSPTTTTETTSEYILTQADLASTAVFQCAVTGENASGASTTFSAFLKSEPKPTNPEPEAATASVGVAESGLSKVITRTNGGEVFEVCSANSSTFDECKQGVAGNGFGQLGEPRSIAVDNSPGGEGAVYVLDDKSPRVQKFSSSGAPILSFGRGVDETTGGDLCTVASGDACGPGLRATDSSPGAFGEWPDTTDLGNELAVGPGGDVYVGDARDGLDGERIQVFDSSGNFVSQALVPVATLGGFGGFQQPHSLTVDSAGNAFVTMQGEHGGLERFSPEEFSLSGEGALRQGNVFDQDGTPVQLALDPRNDRLLVSELNQSSKVSACGGPPVSGRAIAEFDGAGNSLDCTVPVGPGALAQITGMAVSGTGRLYAADGPANEVKVFRLPTPTAPQIGAESATEITTETARLHGQVNPGFEDTTYSVQYGTEDCAGGGCATAEGTTLRGLEFTDGALTVSGLQPNTTYHYRVVAENPLGTTAGPDRTFTTFARVDLTNDPCPNALARKQTKTVALLDCRAYELASSAFAGGYDVVSDIVPEQEPFDASPKAPGKLLYGVKDGGIPGTGNPTNRGIDPYLATRGEDGTWSTRYAGIPADNPFATAPFSSTLLAASSSLDTFAFGGPGICDHCFADGSAGIPVQMPNGELAQGMAGEGSHPAAVPGGYVAAPLSANGEHLIFGSTTRFAAGGNEETGDVSLYDRDLKTGVTKVISNSPAGEGFPEPLPCLQGAGSCHSPADANGIAELAISADGSRVLIAQKVGADAKGNPLWHLYLEVNDDVRSIDLTPATTSGVYFDGMSEDGKKVFLSTTDRLLGEDEDESADVYEAEVQGEGPASLRLISTDSEGNPSNSDSCEPAGEPSSWNSAEANGKCGALAFAGGAGVASGSGAFYFLSPEQLDGGQGAANMPNLYVVQPGANPRFLATIDTSEGKPAPAAPTHPLVSSQFGGAGFEAVQALAVDQSNGDLYAVDPFSEGVYRFDASGAPHDFSAGPGAGTNLLTGIAFEAFNFSSAEVAIDNSPGSLSGELYVASAASVGVYAPSGEKLGSLSGSGTSKGSFSEACGVAVDEATGALYVADHAGYVWQYTPASPSGEITDADYTVKGIATQGIAPCSIAVDTEGHLYAAKATDGPLKQFATSAFASGSPPSIAGAEIDSAARALATDPQTNRLYVDEGDRISVFDSSASGKALEVIGAGKLSCGLLGSRGVAVNSETHHLYASCFEPSAVKEFGYETPPYTPVDNPAILHATNQPETRDYADLQVSADGRYAAFATTMPLQPGYDNASRYEVYRYAAEGQALTCVSCNPTGSQAEGDSSLPAHGLGLLGDGRVFFNSPEQLTLADTNGKQDAYEWEQGTRQLISAGTSAFPSGMLGASADGADAFFFTRDKLVAEDRNGETVKVYDARAGGGHFLIPPPPPCAASDECHGPGSQAPAAPQVGTFKGTGGQFAEEAKPAACHKPKVRRKGRCVKPHPKKKAHKKAHRRHAHAHKKGKRARRRAAASAKGGAR